MMGQQGKRELLDTVRSPYRRASRPEKGVLLDELLTTTEYHRRYLIHLLSHPSEAAEQPERRRKRLHTLPVQPALVQVWRTASSMCARRLVPYMEELVSALERHGELQLDAQTRRLLLKMSRAAADRLLRSARADTNRYGLGTTKPGMLLKKAIPIRALAHWDDKRPGFEVHLVAHCNDSTGGEHLHSVVLTDVATAWTDCKALPNRGQKPVQKAIQQPQQRLPFPLLALDTDNGTEFINANLFCYCKDHGITFTRSRPSRKNDQASVGHLSCRRQGKNCTVVGPIIGYNGYEGPQAVECMRALYQVLRLCVNFFQPVMKPSPRNALAAEWPRSTISPGPPIVACCNRPTKSLPGLSCNNGVCRSTPLHSCRRFRPCRTSSGAWPRARLKSEATWLAQ